MDCGGAQNGGNLDKGDKFWPYAFWGEVPLIFWHALIHSAGVSLYKLSVQISGYLLLDLLKTPS